MAPLVLMSKCGFSKIRTRAGRSKPKPTIGSLSQLWLNSFCFCYPLLSYNFTPLNLAITTDRGITKTFEAITVTMLIG